MGEAVKIAKLEYNTIKQTHAFAKEHGIECDSRPSDTVDIIYDPRAREDGVKAIEMLRTALPDDPVSRYTLWSEEAEEIFLCEGAVGAISYEAGSINAYKFVVGLLKRGLRMGLNLQTKTPVTQLRRSPDGGSGGWEVVTARGTVRASKVVLATNGYTAAIYPKLQGTIVPIRGQITAHRPGSRMPKDGLSTTYSFIHRGGFDYMVPRPPGSKLSGDIVIGGGLTKAEDEGLYQYGTTDDTVVDPAISAYLTQSTETFFGENWGLDHPDGRIRSEWTGIMGYSADGYPLVGEIPGEKGLYISASFQGHGATELALSTVISVFELLTSLAGRDGPCFSLRSGSDEHPIRR
jgi:glycine/D-amino acid oxidase-like deaminating enzyme